jgi:uncharacterized protein
MRASARRFGCFRLSFPSNLRTYLDVMKLSLDTSSASYLIRAYSVGEIVVNERRITESVIVLPERLVLGWPPQNFEELDMQHIQVLAELEPEIVLLGTGSRLRFPSPSLTQPLFEQRVGLEVMDTAAACRTYNILSAEGRKVAAALMMI